jgi:hypothetical protein
VLQERTCPDVLDCLGGDLLIVLDGVARVRAGDCERIVRAGEAFPLPPNRLVSGGGGGSPLRALIISTSA